MSAVGIGAAQHQAKKQKEAIKSSNLKDNIKEKEAFKRQEEVKAIENKQRRESMMNSDSIGPIRKPRLHKWELLRSEFLKKPNRQVNKKLSDLGLYQKRVSKVKRSSQLNPYLLNTRANQRGGDNMEHHKDEDIPNVLPPSLAKVKQALEMNIDINDKFMKENGILDLQSVFQGDSFKEEDDKDAKKLQKQTKSLFIFSEDNRLRRSIQQLLQWKLFEYFILTVIILNSIALSIYDYKDRQSLTRKNQLLDQASTVFTYIFTGECALKIIAQGLVLHKDSYLRDGWNLIDLLVALSGILEQIIQIQISNFKSLRVVRVFRPLRSINSIPSVKKLVSTLIKSLPEFFHVIVFLVFIFAVFAILGTHQYNGVLYNRCRTDPEPQSPDRWEHDISQERVCSQTGLGIVTCPNQETCGNPGDFGIDRSNDGVHENFKINFGILNFDNLPNSLQTVFVIVTCDDWTKIMTNLMDADIPALAAIYCMVIIVVCTFLLMNLILAVIIQAFVTQQRQELEKELMQQDHSNQRLLAVVKNTPQQSFKVSSKQVQLDSASIDSLPLSFNTRQKPSQIDVKPLWETGQENQQEDQEIDYTKERIADFSFLNKITKSKKIINAFLKKPIFSKKSEANLVFFEANEVATQIKRKSFKNQPQIDGFTQIDNPDQSAQPDEIPTDPVLKKLATILQKHKTEFEIIKEEDYNSQEEREEQHQQKQRLDKRVSRASVRSSISMDSGPNDLQLGDSKNCESFDSYKSKDLPKKVKTKKKAKKAQKPDFKHALTRKGIIEEVSLSSDDGEEEEQSPRLNYQIRLVQDSQDKLDVGDQEESKINLSLVKDQDEVQYRTGSDLEHNVLRNQQDIVKNQKAKSNQNYVKYEDQEEVKSQNKGQRMLNIEVKPLDGTILVLNQDDQSIKSSIQLFEAKRKQSLAKFNENKKNEDDLSQDKFFNKVLKETRKSIAVKKLSSKQRPTNLRGLANLKLGIKLNRLKNNIHEEIELIKIEHRAESNKFYNFLMKLTQSKWFSYFISVIIVSNTISLALDHYPPNPQEDMITSHLNLAFTIIYLLEMLMKLTAFGFKGFFRDTFNIFDSFVVLSSIVDFFVERFAHTEDSGVITALRAFRFIRIFKLAKSWKRFYNLLKTILKTVKDISTFSILIFLFIFTYSLLGMELFAYKQHSKEELEKLFQGEGPIANFDNIMSAFTTVFIVLTNDLWTSIYFKYHLVLGATATCYFFTLIIIGQKILLNLFLAILLQNFDEESLNQEIQAQALKKKEKDEGITKSKRVWFINCLKRICGKRCHKTRKYLQENIISEDENDQQSLDKSSIESDDDSAMKSADANFENEANTTAKGLLQNRAQKKKTIKKSSKRQSKNLKQMPEIYGISLGCLSQKNPFRNFCFNVVTNPYFEYSIVFIIMVSGVQLALENPLTDPNSSQIAILSWIDMVTTGIFCLEALLKIIAFGFLLNSKGSYLRNYWNALDFCIIIFSIMSLTSLSDHFKIFKMFRVVRALRLLSKNEGLQLALQAMASAVPHIAIVTVIMLLFFLTFGIVAVSYFKGKLFQCSMHGVDFENAEELEIISKWDCLNSGGYWFNTERSFDNIEVAMMTFFQMATTQGWQNIMFLTSSATEIDHVPHEEHHSIPWTLFFMFFIIVGWCFLLNLFVGVVISTFNRQKDLIGGNSLLTDRQKEWIDTKMIALKAKPIKLMRPPSNKLRRILFKVQENLWFERVVSVCIVLNTLILTLKWYNIPSQVSQFTDTANQIFTVIFILEALIKIIALGRQYFKENWNIFDFIIIIGSIISQLITMAFQSLSLGGATTIIRAFRISRILRLVKRAKNLRLIFNTFVFTLPALANVGGLLLLLLYLYSIVGVILFSGVKRNGLMSDQQNFENFQNSFMTLFSFATGDFWSDIMHSTMKEQTVQFHCIENPSYDDYVNNGYQTIGCGVGDVGKLFFYSYIIFVNLVFLNLFIAIILQGFDETQNKESRLFNQETLDHFRITWTKYDPDATTFIKISELSVFLFDLGFPLGFDESFAHDQQKQNKFIAMLDLPIYNNFQDYRFLDVIDALSMRLVVQQLLLHEKERKQQLQEQDSIIDQGIDEEEVKKNKHVSSLEEKKLKSQIEQDLKKLDQDKAKTKIQALKELEKDKKRATIEQGQAQQDMHFTSLHSAAAREVVSHMKFIVAKRKFFKSTIVPQSKSSDAEILQLSSSESKNQLKSSQNLGIYADIQNISPQFQVDSSQIPKTKRYLEPTIQQFQRKQTRRQSQPSEIEKIKTGGEIEQTLQIQSLLPPINVENVSKAQKIIELNPKVSNELIIPNLELQDVKDRLSLSKESGSKRKSQRVLFQGSYIQNEGEHLKNPLPRNQNKSKRLSLFSKNKKPQSPTKKPDETEINRQDSSDKQESQEESKNNRKESIQQPLTTQRINNLIQEELLDYEIDTHSSQQTYSEDLSQNFKQSFEAQDGLQVEEQVFEEFNIQGVVSSQNRANKSRKKKSVARAILQQTLNSARSRDNSQNVRENRVQENQNKRLLINKLQVIIELMISIGNLEDQWEAQMAGNLINAAVRFVKFLLKWIIIL